MWVVYIGFEYFRSKKVLNIFESVNLTGAGPWIDIKILGWTLGHAGTITFVYSLV